METKIPLNGRLYTFETDAATRKTALKLEVESTSKQNKQPTMQPIPSVWLVTSSNGLPLFALKPAPSDQSFRILTAKELYEDAAQWFEPLADNYRENIWINPESLIAGTPTYSSYKHLKWHQIIDFSKIDRPSFKFYAGLEGDWKQASDGGAGYLLVMVEGKPYWADAIGQIPFAVDTYKMYLKQLGDTEKAIIETVKTGISWGDGKLFGSSDYTNEYDNYMVLRGALWAKENHRIKTKKVTLRDIPEPGLLTPYPQTYEEHIVIFAATSNARLISPIDATSVSAYGIWRLGK